MDTNGLLDEHHFGGQASVSSLTRNKMLGWAQDHALFKGLGKVGQKLVAQINGSDNAEVRVESWLLFFECFFDSLFFRRNRGSPISCTAMLSYFTAPSRWKLGMERRKQCSRTNAKFS